MKKREQVNASCNKFNDSDKLKSKINLFLDELETNANEYWNKFYSIHENKFFKDRNWLFTEFPELLFDSPNNNDESMAVLEVGCGVGNTVFPIIRSNK